MMADITFWNGFHYWWIIPLVMMILCFIRMFGRRDCGLGYSHNRQESAEEILNKRYARGEIGKAEYEEKKKDILTAA
jgi:uncharacterized membrane protein